MSKAFTELLIENALMREVKTQYIRDHKYRKVGCQSVFYQFRYVLRSASEVC